MPLNLDSGYLALVHRRLSAKNTSFCLMRKSDAMPSAAVFNSIFAAQQKLSWFGPNLHKICPKVITLRNVAEKLSKLATVENLMTLARF